MTKTAWIAFIIFLLIGKVTEAKAENVILKPEVQVEHVETLSLNPIGIATQVLKFLVVDVTLDWVAGELQKLYGVDDFSLIDDTPEEMAVKIEEKYKWGYPEEAFDLSGMETF